MPFSTKLEQEYRELVQENLRKVSFNDEKEIIHFCDLVDNLVSLSPAEVKSGKFQEDLNNIKELISEGFDLYATDKIIDLRTDVQVGRSSHSPWVRVPAFASEQKERSLRIEEAKVEFKKIIISEIRTRVNELRTMSTIAKNQYISEQQKEHKRAEECHRIMAEHKAPPDTKLTEDANYGLALSPNDILELAIRSNSPALVQSIIMHTNINLPSTDEFLRYAIRSNNIDLVRTIIFHRAGINNDASQYLQNHSIFSQQSQEIVLEEQQRITTKWCAIL